MRTGISIVLCCYDSASRLPETLRALSLQEVSAELEWEIVVVDNASTDNTGEIAMQLWEDYGQSTPLKVIREEKAGLGHARRKGVAEAMYDYLLFCDDDNWLCNSYVQGIYEKLEAYPEVAAVGGLGIPVFETQEPEWFDEYAEAYAVGSQEITLENGRILNLYGAGMGMNRKAWEALHQRGFQSLLKDRLGKSLSSSGDTELTYAFVLMGMKLYFAPELTFYHYLPKARLERSYLKKLFTAFGKDGPVRNMYYAHVSERYFHKRIQSWYFHLSLALFRMGKYLLKPPKKGGRSIYFNWSIAYVKRLIGLRREYKTIWNKIGSLKEQPGTAVDAKAGTRSHYP